MESLFSRCVSRDSRREMDAFLNEGMTSFSPSSRRFFHHACVEARQKRPLGLMIKAASDVSHHRPLSPETNFQNHSVLCGRSEFVSRDGANFSRNSSAHRRKASSAAACRKVYSQCFSDVSDVHDSVGFHGRYPARFRASIAGTRA